VVCYRAAEQTRLGVVISVAYEAVVESGVVYFQDYTTYMLSGGRQEKAPPDVCSGVDLITYRRF